MSELEQQAIEDFGAQVVSEVLALVEVSDPDGIWAMFQDMEMEDHASCVEFLYFDN
jgi:tetrahydromethanopterin S-methyltransferase subunit A